MSGKSVTIIPMRNNPLMIIFLTAFILLISSGQVSSLNDELENPIPVIRVSEILKSRIRDAGSSANLLAGGEKLQTSKMIGRYYAERGFQPVWVHDKNFPAAAGELIDAINSAYLEGLAPASYHLEEIRSVLRKARKAVSNKAVSDIDVLVDLDLLLTDAFLMLSCHYSAGCENPAVMEAKWLTDSEDIDVMSVLEMSSRERRIKEALSELLPSGNDYSKLRRALAEHRSIAENGGWPEFSKGPLLALGADGKRVMELRKRLFISGDLVPDDDTGTPLFDNALKEVVLRFQKRHGLRTDGIVGPRTRGALNITARSRARQIELNLERLRWSRKDFFKRYILVNIADFRLDVIEEGRSVMSMKVVVGKPYWNTPVFNKNMTHIILNPSWNIPRSITVDEILPNIRSNDDYLKIHKIKIVDSWDDSAEEISPDSIDWTNISDEDFHYLLRQESGPLNPLGRIKFLFSNRFNIYMHDTPSKVDFSNDMRIFSHGCIRLEQPVKLAEYLLKDTPGWTAESIQQAVRGGEERKVRLAEPVGVQVIYLTAWVDEEGLVQFRNDIYGRDRRLDIYLRDQ